MLETATTQSIALYSPNTIKVRWNPSGTLGLKILVSVVRFYPCPPNLNLDDEVMPILRTTADFSHKPSFPNSEARVPDANSDR